MLNKIKWYLIIAGCGIALGAIVVLIILKPTKADNKGGKDEFKEKLYETKDALEKQISENREYINNPGTYQRRERV